MIKVMTSLAPILVIGAMMQAAEINVAVDGVNTHSGTKANSETIVMVDPVTRHQRIEGWGASLAWWASVVGGWPDQQVDEICDWITATDGLNMNIFRFNIGGGDAPGHDHMRKDGGAMPGYRATADGPYDWDADANQRSILLKLKARRPDALFEAFSNSPPWWMTKSGCAAGSTDGSNNLREDCYDDFADYLTEVVRDYKEKHGVIFRTLAPMNEPDADWWKAMGNQEGCHFTVDKQVQILDETYRHLHRKGLLPATRLSAMDANNIDQCLAALNGYIALKATPHIGQINTHSYFGSKRQELAALARELQRPLWQSETGPLHVKETGLANHLVIAQRIITDLRELKPTAWLDWQIIAQDDPQWGLISANYQTKTYRKSKSFFIRSQFTRFIQPGFTILETSEKNSIAAISPDNKRLVVILCHAGDKVLPTAIDLSRFREIRGPASVYQTTAELDCAAVDPVTVENKRLSLTLPAASVTTLIINLDL